MHVHFEQNTYTRTDSNFHSLSWMGKVPDSLPDEWGGWKLNPTQYYMEGWLASGNGKGVVGITFTTSHCQKYEAPPRSNFNLRGHRSEVILVKWNEPYQRLATCDSRGVIFVWFKREGRWSIELINDRNSQVTDFAWSHNGRMALICYRDGFVLVGSVGGQRYWSSMLNLDNTSITCGIWSPDDQEVMFGTSDGQVIVMSSTGAMIRQFTVNEGSEITSMAWSCEKFNMEEAVDEDHSSVLAIVFKFGDIYLVNGYDDVCPCTVRTSLQGLKIEWSNCGQFLAVGGFLRLPNLQCHNELHFYSTEGKRIHLVTVPSQGKPLTALTWGHNDKRLFLAVGCQLYVAWVSKQVAPLNFLCNRVVHRCVRHEKNADLLPLPQRLRQGVQALFSPTVKSYIPDPFKLRGFVSTPPPGNERLFCTMIRHGDETSGGHYTLYLEYLGGLVPLLKGKRASKLRPDFVIFDPKIRTSGKSQNDSNSLQTDSSSESEADVVTDGCGSPRMQRRRRQKVFRAEKVDRSITFRTLDELLYNDNLPESNKLIEVTSNIWGTKFQITGVASYLPSMLGNVVYKTSLLHLQPRQMTINLQEIGNNNPQHLARDPNFTPACASDDDDDSSWPGEGEVPDVSQSAQPVTFPGDSWSEIGSSQVCCVDVQTANAATITPVHSNNNNNNNASVATSTTVINNNNNNNNSSAAHDLDTTACVIVNSDGSSGVGGGNNGGVGCVGGGVSSLSTKLNAAGSIRSKSLSPVQDSYTQTSTVAFNGEVNTLLTNNLTKDIYAAQGARPKVRKNNSANATNPINSSTTTTTTTAHHQPKRPSSVKTLPSPTSTSYVSSSTTTTTTTYANGSISAASEPTAATTTATTTVSTTTTTTTSAAATKSSSSSSSSPSSAIPGSDAMATAADSVAVQAAMTCSPVSPEPEVAGIFKRISSGGGEGGSRWADPASMPIKYTDEEVVSDSSELPFENNLVADLSASSAPSSVILERRLYLAQKTLVPGEEGGGGGGGFGEDPAAVRSRSEDSLSSGGGVGGVVGGGVGGVVEVKSKPHPIVHNRVRLESVGVGSEESHGTTGAAVISPMVEEPNRTECGGMLFEPLPTISSTAQDAPPAHSSSSLSSCSSSAAAAVAAAGLLSNGIGVGSGSIEILHSASLPSSPIHGASRADTPTRKAREEAMKGQCRHLSPVLRRKGKPAAGGGGVGVGGGGSGGGGAGGGGGDSLEEDLVLTVMEDFKGGQTYHNLETFQKAQLKHKLRRAQGTCREPFVMHNKAPLWNENSQVYQLDFGGRVTQESAKNFQIELQGKQVMQFGRIDSNAYTLDFQYPFTALQAFAVALANVTQRLK